MKKLGQRIFLLCGLLTTLAAVPVFAQETQNIEINKMPFNDFALTLKQKVDAGEVDLTKSFSVELEGVLTKDGKLDAKQSKFMKSAGDAAMVEVGKSFILTVSDSGFFEYLKNFGIEKFNLSLVQSEKEVFAVITSEMETPEKTKRLTSVLNSMRQLLLSADKAKRDKGEKGFDEDGKILIGGLSVRSEEKTLMMNFAYEKPIIQEMVNRQLKRDKTKHATSE